MEVIPEVFFPIPIPFLEYGPQKRMMHMILLIRAAVYVEGHFFLN